MGICSSKESIPTEESPTVPKSYVIKLIDLVHVDERAASDPFWNSYQPKMKCQSISFACICLTRNSDFNSIGNASFVLNVSCHSCYGFQAKAGDLFNGGQVSAGWSEMC